MKYLLTILLVFTLQFGFSQKNYSIISDTLSLTSLVTKTGYDLLGKTLVSFANDSIEILRTDMHIKAKVEYLGYEPVSEMLMYKSLTSDSAYIYVDPIFSKIMIVLPKPEE